MRNYNETDMAFYDLENQIEGDFIVDETGDFALTADYESARQDITNRLRTQKGDWRSHPNLGADLELLEGEPNTRETGMQGTTQIYEALTYDHRFNLEDLHVRAVPTSIEEIQFFVLLDADENGTVVINQPLQL
jgi:phage baseplate assembly protein W